MIQDLHPANHLKIKAFPEKDKETPVLRLETSGVDGSKAVDFTNQRTVFDRYICSENGVRAAYNFSHFFQTVKALSASTKASLRIDRNLVANLQVLMPTANGSNSEANGFVEFLVSLPHLSAADRSHQKVAVHSHQRGIRPIAMSRPMDADFWPLSG